MLVLLAVPHKHLYVLYYAWMFCSAKITNKLVPQFLQAWNGDGNVISTGCLYICASHVETLLELNWLVCILIFISKIETVLERNCGHIKSIAHCNRHWLRCTLWPTVVVLELCCIHHAKSCCSGVIFYKVTKWFYMEVHRNGSSSSDISFNFT